MERMVIEYLANALWQVSVLAAGAWLLLRLWKPGPAAQHWVWLTVLGLGLVLPIRGTVPAQIATTAAGTSSAANFSAAAFHSAGEPAGMMVGEQRSGTRAEWTGLVAALFSASVQKVSLSVAAVRWIEGVWLAVMLLGLVRLAGAWRAARRLVAGSRALELRGRERTALAECARRLRVAAPEIRESDGIAGPVVVGAFAPVLLWPLGFRRCSEDELRATLCHELAHVRRRDYGLNLVCEAAAAPMKWHPAARGVERRIRATREMACDAMAASAMESETVYAECLVRLARSIAGLGMAEGSVAAGLFNGNVMEERVMRLMKGRMAMSWRVRLVRGVAGAAAMMATMAAAGMFHVVPAMAQGSDAAVMRSAAGSVPVAVASQTIPATPPVPTAPASPVKAEIPDVPAIPPAPAAPVVHAVRPIPGAPPTPPAPPAPVNQAVPPVHGAPPPPPASPRARRSKSVVILNGQERELTPAERARVEKQLAEAQRKIAEATAKINSPKFRRQIAEAQQKALAAQTMLNSAQFKRQMADAQKQIAETTAKVNSPEFQKRIQAEIDAVAKVNGPEFQKAIGDAQASALRAQTMINEAEFQKCMADAQKQIAEATARLNSPEFKKQIENAARAAARVNSAEFQKQMAEAQKQVADAMARMKAEQKKSVAK